MYLMCVLFTAYGVDDTFNDVDYDLNAVCAVYALHDAYDAFDANDVYDDKTDCACNVQYA